VERGKGGGEGEWSDFVGDKAGLFRGRATSRRLVPKVRLWECPSAGGTLFRGGVGALSLAVERIRNRRNGGAPSVVHSCRKRPDLPCHGTEFPPQIGIPKAPLWEQGVGNKKLESLRCSRGRQHLRAFVSLCETYYPSGAWAARASHSAVVRARSSAMAMSWRFSSMAAPPRS
jgi:hypothetical protein